MLIRKEKGGHCFICGKYVPDYEPEYCCGGSDCGCKGMPIEPPVCSADCWRKLLPPHSNKNIPRL